VLDLADPSFRHSLVLHLAAKLLSIRLMANGARLVVEQIELLQILQYESATSPVASSTEASLTSEFRDIRFSSQQYFQIEVQCRSRTTRAHGDQQNNRYTIHGKLSILSMFRKATTWLTQNTIVAHDSVVTSGKGVRHATISKVICVHEAATENDAKVIKCDEVGFEFLDRLGKITCDLVCILY
jgi:hypothetical protein